MVAKNIGSIVTYHYRITDASPGITNSVHELWAFLNDDNSINTRFLNGDGANERIAQQTIVQTFWLLEDRVGSTRDIQDQNGTIAYSVVYDAFGNGALGLNAYTTFGFAGYLYHDETGLYSTHWRWYDPSNGQWTTEDPLGLSAGDPNFRRYVGNNGANASDPSGLLDITALLSSDQKYKIESQYNALLSRIHFRTFYQYKYIEQGKNNDCWLFSAMSALAYHRNADYRKLVVCNNDTLCGSTFKYTVQLPGFEKKRMRSM